MVILFKLAQKIRELYWRVFRPKTFGVKAALVDHRGIWLVRHSYYNSHRWNLPGGGYKPKGELARNAVLREVDEELNANIVSEPKKVCMYMPKDEYKQDEVSIFEMTVRGAVSKASKEILEVRYFKFDSLKKVNLSRSVEKYLLSKGYLAIEHVSYPDLLETLGPSK